MCYFYQTLLTIVSLNKRGSEVEHVCQRPDHLDVPAIKVLQDAPLVAAVQRARLPLKHRYLYRQDHQLEEVFTDWVNRSPHQYIE